MIRQCPKCGKIFRGNRSRCNGYFPGGKRCETVTVEIFEDAPISPPREGPDKPAPEVKEDEDGIIGRAGEIVDALTKFGPMAYKELAEELGLTYKRVVRLVSQMVRDGVKLKREGRPRKVRLE